MKKYVLCDYDYEVCNKLLIDFEVEKRVREVVEEVIYVMKEFWWEVRKKVVVD